MSYFAAVKITDINGNVVEFQSIDEVLTDIREELKAIRAILNEMANTNIEREDLQ